MRLSAVKAGDRYGRLVVLPGRATRVGFSYKVEVLCDCGQQRSVYRQSLTSGHTQSCGCLHAERVSARHPRMTEGKRQARMRRLAALMPPLPEEPLS